MVSCRRRGFGEHGALLEEVVNAGKSWMICGAANATATDSQGGECEWERCHYWQPIGDSNHKDDVETSAVDGTMLSCEHFCCLVFRVKTIAIGGGSTRQHVVAHRHRGASLGHHHRRCVSKAFSFTHYMRHGHGNRDGPTR